MKQIIDTFSFYNELDMLTFRLEYLYAVVDKFILVESTLTHAGNPKKLFYEENKALYEKYHDKIVHVIVDDLPDITVEKDAWVREKMQRNSWTRGIKDININDDDLILINDVDEIPDRNTLIDMKYQKLDNIIYIFQQDMYYYNLYCMKYGKWGHAKALNYFTFKNLSDSNSSDIRLNKINIQYSSVSKGGWHFSYFGDIEYIKNKIKNFAHQEFNKDEFLDDEKIRLQILQCKDVYFRDDNPFYYVDIKYNPYLPDNYEKLLVFNKYYDDFRK